MDAERMRLLALKLPHVEETEQWGGLLVFWVGDKAVGGKMFAVLDLEGGEGKPVCSLSVGPERYHELLETPGVGPAPYLARAHWVALAHWQALPAGELRALLQAAHARTEQRLTRRTRATLALSRVEYREAVTAGRASAAKI